MKLLLSILVAILCIGNAYAQKFEDYFVNKSIRVDYIFAGNSSAQQIYLDELSALPQWAGRKTHLNEVPLKGNGQIIMKDIKTQQVIYKTSFSSLFQEWITTDEAKQIAKSFENSFVLPYPKDSVEVVALLFDSYGKETSKLKHIIDPKDILIHQKNLRTSHTNTLYKTATIANALTLLFLQKVTRKKRCNNSMLMQKLPVKAFLSMNLSNQ